jgi:hypothetical protein
MLALALALGGVEGQIGIGDRGVGYPDLQCHSRGALVSRRVSESASRRKTV